MQQLKHGDDVVQVGEVSVYLKQKMHEYQRRDISSLDKQVQSTLDQTYFDKSGLNIRKPCYKKRDFIDEVEPEPIIDSYGEELIEHKSLNLMN